MILHPSWMLEVSGPTSRQGISDHGKGMVLFRHLKVYVCVAQLFVHTCVLLFLLCSRNDVGDSPRGPLKQPGNPHLKPATSQNQMRIA
jgi:hypothetical protein